MNDRSGRPQLHGQAQVSGGFRGPGKSGVKQAPRLHYPAQRLVEGERAIEVGQCLGKSPQLFVDLPARADGPGVVRQQLDGAVEVGKRALELPGLPERVAPFSQRPTPTAGQVPVPCPDPRLPWHSLR